ncbi:unnamed protein product [Prorocentrum cordatum]|uniref:Uncharacterized protein n=1 Tax=Prorocentrum cordatum TaxID=2364126 RepID=A0ABN9WCD5_9DINO|nr:unnamed protein product [Polarella glacialis]
MKNAPLLLQLLWPISQTRPSTVEPSSTVLEEGKEEEEEEDEEEEEEGGVHEGIWLRRAPLGCGGYRCPACLTRGPRRGPARHRLPRAPAPAAAARRGARAAASQAGIGDSAAPATQPGPCSALFRLKICSRATTVHSSHDSQQHLVPQSASPADPASPGCQYSPRRGRAIAIAIATAGTETTIGSPDRAGRLTSCTRPWESTSTE